jgi:CDP-L-myo-inositol myo-inositolphosphotransferase
MAVLNQLRPGSLASELRAPVQTAVLLGAGDGERLGPVAKGKPKCLVNLLGLTLLERNLRALKQAGIRELLLVVGYQGGAVEEFVQALAWQGLNIRCLPHPDWRLGNGTSLMRARAAVSDQPRFLVLMADHLFTPEAFGDFLSRVADGSQSHMLVDFHPDTSVDKNDATYVRLSNGRQVCALGKGLGEAHGVDCGLFVFNQAIFPALEAAFAAEDYSLTGGCRTLARRQPLVAVPFPEGFWQDIDTPADYQNAKKKLLAALPGSADGLVARYLNRRLSRPFTLWWSRTRVTPNQVTVFSSLLALAGALLFALRQPLWGGLTVQLASIVDAADGELARLRLETSPSGAFLDSLLDRYADGLILFAMGFYAYSLSPGWLPLLVTAAALLGVPLSMVFKDRYRVCFGRAYSSQADDGWLRYLLPNRDGRLLVVMLGGVSGFVLPALAIIAVVSHAAFFWRLRHWRRAP